MVKNSSAELGWICGSAFDFNLLNYAKLGRH